MTYQLNIKPNIILFTLFLFLTFPSQVLATTYYISPSGNDSNTGTQSHPIKTFVKADSLLKAGDTLKLLAGTYNQILKIKASGTSEQPITITSDQDRAVINTYGISDISASGVFNGSHINVSNLEIKNSEGFCVIIKGDHINLSNLFVHECEGQGVQFSGNYGSFRDSTITRACLENESRNISGGWPSALKVRIGENISIENNHIYNNYGEGMGLRGKHISVKNNNVHDNYSVNIYMGNSYDILIDSNFAYCTGNSEFYRNNHCASNISISEEYYSGWGSNLGKLTIINNILAYGYHNFNYFGYEDGVETPGVKGALIANNTIWGSKDRAIRFNDEEYNRDIYFYNNIVQQDQGRLADIEGTRGVTADYNFWVGNPTVLNNASGPHDLTGPINLATTPNYNDPQSFRLNDQSPAINAGLSLAQVTLDYSGLSRNTTPSMGAIEFNPTSTPTKLITDLVGTTHIVDIYDYTEFIRQFGSTGSADFNNSGTVDIYDYSRFVTDYGKTW